MPVRRRAVGDTVRQMARQLDDPDVVVTGAVEGHGHRLLVRAQFGRRNEIGLRLACRPRRRSLPVDPDELTALRRSKPVRQHSGIGHGEHGIGRGGVEALRDDFRVALHATCLEIEVIRLQRALPDGEKRRRRRKAADALVRHDANRRRPVERCRNTPLVARYRASTRRRTVCRRGETAGSGDRARSFARLGHGLRRAAARGDAHDRTEQRRAEENVPSRIPRAAAAVQHIRNLQGLSTGGIDALQFVVGEKAERAAIGRPERIAGAFGAFEHPALDAVERTHPEHRGALAVRDEGDLRPVRRQGHRRVVGRQRWNLKAERREARGGLRPGSQRPNTTAPNAAPSASRATTGTLRRFAGGGTAGAGGAVGFSRTHRSSPVTSPMLCHRRSGSFSKERRRT